MIAAADLVGSQPFNALLTDELEAVEQARTTHSAHCLAGLGFPQVLETFDPEQPLGSFAYKLSDFGPVTAEHAREYGMTRPDLVDPSAPLQTVWSNDPAFEEASQSCRQRLADEVGDIEELAFAYNDFENQVQSRVLAELTQDDGHVGAYQKLLSCLADEHGWPDTSPEDVVAEGWRALGIPFGQLDESRPEPPQGTNVTVVLTMDPPTYEPTEQETELAVDIVDCRGRTGFDTAIAQSYNDAQATALDGQHAQLQEFAARFDEVLRDVERAGW